MSFLTDPALIAVYLFLLSLPVGALGMRITEEGHKRKNDWIDGIGTAVEGVAAALSVLILYPILIVTVVLTEIWVAAFQAVFSLF
jgi:hypothetical protein